MASVVSGSTTIPRRRSRRFKTFDIVEVGLRPGNDGRPESRKPSIETLKITGHIDTWAARGEWINRTIGPSVSAMVLGGRTLAPVAVRNVMEFLAEPTAAEWTLKQKEMLKQELMFGNRQPLEKIPYEFRVRWRDDGGKEHKSLVLAWELYQTWRSYGRRYKDPLPVMRDKFMSDVFGPKRQLGFFMGNHSRFRDNWMICGWFNPPKESVKNGYLF
jgi:hypothetical protein